eukprot:m.54357 g.54357  ORF g.54357 m.54357 type:complete len:410 (-) comp13244_c0_seq1:261-1490(-)
MQVFRFSTVIFAVCLATSAFCLTSTTILSLSRSSSFFLAMQLFKSRFSCSSAPTCASFASRKALTSARWPACTSDLASSIDRSRAACVSSISTFSRSWISFSSASRRAISSIFCLTIFSWSTCCRSQLSESSIQLSEESCLSPARSTSIAATQISDAALRKRKQVKHTGFGTTFSVCVSRSRLPRRVRCWLSWIFAAAEICTKSCSHASAFVTVSPGLRPETNVAPLTDGSIRRRTSRSMEISSMYCTISARTSTTSFLASERAVLDEAAAWMISCTQNTKSATEDTLQSVCTWPEQLVSSVNVCLWWHWCVVVAQATKMRSISSISSVSRSPSSTDASRESKGSSDEHTLRSAHDEQCTIPCELNRVSINRWTMVMHSAKVPKGTWAARCRQTAKPSIASTSYFLCQP